MFGLVVDAAAREHALRSWPHESVGFVVGGSYCPQENIATDKVREFRVADSAWSDAVQAVIHSHTTSMSCAPGEADMRSQLSAAVPYGIVATDGRCTTPLLWFGDHVLDAPLVGRTFVPGVTDCYELVRAWMWQERGIKLRSYPRDAGWWRLGKDLLAQNFRDAGFAPVEGGGIAVGDVAIMAVPVGKIANHCGVLVGGNMLLHHRANQLSRRELWSDSWQRLTRLVVRYAR